MRYLRNLRVWFGVPVVLAGVVVGLLTNLVTTEPTWPLAAGLFAAVLVLVGLTVGQGVVQAAGKDRDQVAGLRAARAEEDLASHLDGSP